MDYITLTNIDVSKLIEKINIQLAEGRIITTIVGYIEGDGEDINTYDLIAVKPVE